MRSFYPKLLKSKILMEKIKASHTKTNSFLFEILLRILLAKPVSYAQEKIKAAHAKEKITTLFKRNQEDLLRRDKKG